MHVAVMPAPGPAGPTPPGRVLIGFKSAPGRNDEEIVRQAGGKIKATFQIVPVIAATVPEQALQGLQHNPRIEYIEPDAEAFAAADAIPWGITRVKANLVWPTGDLGAGVKVAVVDSGLDYRHPDLGPVYKGGYDFVNDDSDPLDDHGHGTHVAGTIAAAANGTGVKGVAPMAGLYALKVLAAGGSGTYSDIIAALQWSVNNGMKIASMSLGGTVPSTSMKNACSAAYSAGVLLVAAAGNNGQASGGASNVLYPAAYWMVIAVAATDSQNRRAAFSSTGKQVELAAPGVKISSDRLGGGLQTLSGTSMACPHVTGVAALMIANGMTGPAAIRQKLHNTAKDLGPAGRDTSYGFGLVNAQKAVAP